MHREFNNIKKYEYFIILGLLFCDYYSGAIIEGPLF